ncbi:MAG: cytochrome c3 family protein [Elusimicrobiota bacterium]
MKSVMASRKFFLFGSLVFLIYALRADAVAQALAPAPIDTCRDCHQDEKFRVQNKKIYEYFQDWKGSSHDLAGVTCTACHAGDQTKNEKNEAHKGILPQSNPESPFHYKNIPKTCGGCHASILERYQKSRHYDLLVKAGRGPSCITCHGALNAKVYSMAIIQRACSSCHNKRTGNKPQIIAEAQEILGRLNYAKGYRNGLAFYYKSIHKPEAMKVVDAAYSDVILFWHEFDFKRLAPRSKELLAEFKTIYVKAHEAPKEIKK